MRDLKTSCQIPDDQVRVCGEKGNGILERSSRSPIFLERGLSYLEQDYQRHRHSVPPYYGTRNGRKSGGDQG